MRFCENSTIFAPPPMSFPLMKFSKLKKIFNFALFYFSKRDIAILMISELFFRIERSLPYPKINDGDRLE